MRTTVAPVEFTGEMLTITPDEFLSQSASKAPFVKPISVTLDAVLRNLPGRRQVWRAHWEGAEPLLLKRYLPHPHQERDQQREWKNIKKLSALDLNFPVPLFSGKDAEGAAIIALSYIKDARTLQEHLFDNCTKTERRIIFKKLLETLAAQHHVGVWQHDPHLENFLWRAPEIYPVDAAEFCFRSTRKSGLDLTTRVRSLSRVFIQLPYAWEQELWETLPVYIQNWGINDLSKQTTASFLQSLRRCIPRYRKRRLVRYLKKTQRSCSEFASSHFQNGLLICKRELPLTLKKRLIEDPDGLLAEGKLIKSGTTATVAEVTDEDDRPYILKRYNPKPWSYRLSHLHSPSRARRSWVNGNGWRIAGLPTPQPWACLEEKAGPFTIRSFLLTAKAPGIPLSDFVSEHQQQPDILRAAALALNDVWKGWRMFRAVHGDLKANNILADTNGRLYFIDLDSFRFFLPPLLYRERLKKDRRRFMQNWQNNPEVAAIFEEALT